jgi:zinc finger MIZ domain-containing protein
LPLIEEHIRVTGGFQALNMELERPRFILLQDACNNEDYFYVTLHQFFCLWTIDRSLIADIDGFRDNHTVTFAFNVLSQLIRDNQALSNVHLTWFSLFPAPLKDLLARSDHYYRTTNNVSRFLARLKIHWTSLTNECKQRGYPPLVDELVNRLGLLSPVLQGVFFTASRRNLGIGDNEIGAQMEALFVQDRAGHRELAARYNTSFPPSELDVRERNAGLANRYIQLRQKESGLQIHTAQQVMTSGSASTTPVLGNFGNTQHNIRQAQQVPRENYSAAQSPDPAERIETLYRQSLPAVSPTSASPSTGYELASCQVFNTNTQQAATAPYNPNFQMTFQQPVAQGPGYLKPQQILRSNDSQNPSNNGTPSAYLGPAQNHQAQVQLQSLSQQPILNQGNPLNPTNYNYIPASHIHQQRMIFQPNTQGQNGASIIGQRLQQHGRLFGGPPPNRTASSQEPVTRNIPSGAYSNSIGNRFPSDRQPQQLGAGRMTTPSAPLIPKTSYVPPPQAPIPEMNALHQAHLRSPYLVAADSPPLLAQLDSAYRYYQVIKDFAVAPFTLSKDLSVWKLEFRVPEAIFYKIAGCRLMSANAPATREVRSGSLQYRMRCVQLKNPQGKCDPSDWVVSDTAWPASIFFKINNTHLDIRRKILHGKDLPLDITDHVLSQGTNNVNRVSFSITQPKKPQKEATYAFAVEIIEILHHQQIMDMCLQKQRIPAEQTINSIKASLSGSVGDDDEISMVTSDLTIDLADPFLARIFTTPVRGSNCLHRECFDLETYLNTRNSRQKRPQQPCMVDVWKCPLCSRDARPYSLRVDDFLVSVRESLAKQNLLDTKSIAISADGTWKPKPESQPKKRNSSRAGMGDDSEDSEFEKKLENIATKPMAIEIIELDDD